MQLNTILHNLRPCEHQVAGHLFEEGKAGSLVDDRGHFYKPIQPGPRGDRERAFYEYIHTCREVDKASWAQGTWSAASSAAVQAVSEGHHINLLLSPSDGDAVTHGGEIMDPSPVQRPTTPSRAIPVPTSPSSALLQNTQSQFPTFRCQPSFSAIRGLSRGPVEVLERDELGLVDAHVVEELLQWSDEDAACCPGHVSDDSYSRSPDSDDGGALTTGESVMEGISKAFSLRTSSLDNQKTPRKSIDEAVAAYTRAEDAQAAALLGQSAFARDNDNVSVLADGNGNGNNGVVAVGEGGGANTAAGTWSRRTLPRRGTATSRSSCSVEEALRIHSLSLAAAETETDANSVDDGISAGQQAGSSSRDSSFSGGASPPSTTTTTITIKHSAREQSNSTERAGRVGEPSRYPASRLAALPFTVRNAPLLRVIPKFYGVREADGRVLLELEDLARWYQHPCIMDIKIGHRTWYSHAESDYIDRCRKKDAATTQATLGFKICGMQVFRHGRGGYWRASKRWCKTLPELLVDKALTSFAHNEHGLRPADVYGGPQGAVAQLRSLESWFELQREFQFYSASVLILYEGDAEGMEHANVRVRLVDFAHTFRVPTEHTTIDNAAVTNNGGAAAEELGASAASPQQHDDNFLGGLRALITRLTAVSRFDVADSLM